MDFLHLLGIETQNKGVLTGNNWLKTSGKTIDSYSPVDGKLIASVETADLNAYQQTIEVAQKAFLEWRNWPAPKRGEVVRQIGQALREHKDPLGKLVSYEMGKAFKKVMVKFKK